MSILAASRTRAGRIRLPPAAKRSDIGAETTSGSAAISARRFDSMPARSAATGPKRLDASSMSSASPTAEPQARRIYTVDGGFQQRVVSASEHERVCAQADDVLQVAPQHLLSPWRVSFACLDDVDQLWARLLVHADHRVDLLDCMQVLLATHRALGRDHADPVVLRGLHCRLRAGADHADDRNFEDLARVVERGGGCGVARDHDELDVTAFEVADDVDREAANLVLEARAVWKMQQVGDVDGGLQRQALADRPEHSEPAHAGIEDPDGPRVAFRPTPIHLV